MTNRTWFGGTGNAATPRNWSPRGVPVAGDTLFMYSGTMTAARNVLQGDKLNIGLFSDPVGATAVNLRNVTTPEEVLAYSINGGTTTTINVTGQLHALLAPEYRQNMVINIAKGINLERWISTKLYRHHSHNQRSRNVQ